METKNIIVGVLVIGLLIGGCAAIFAYWDYENKIPAPNEPFIKKTIVEYENAEGKG